MKQRYPDFGYSRNGFPSANYRAKILFLLVLGLMTCVCYGQTASQTIILATTTSTQQTGLLDILLPAFKKATGIEVKPIAVGTGKALELARNGDADVIMVHARNLEDKFVADGYGVNPWDLMFNDFILLGPDNDPEKVKEAKTAVEAFKKIAAGKTRFVSRGDKSGTHEKELSIWGETKTKPVDRAYIEAGQGMSETLKMAAEMQAYVLCDRATWLSMNKNVPSLTIVFENPEELKNPYGVIAVSDAKIPKVKTELACKFIEWVVGKESQEIISNFKVEGATLFHLSVKKR